MKSSKEKAVELVDKHRTIIRKADTYNNLSPDDEIFLAKEAALVTIKAILETSVVSRLWVWKEVKEEIEQL